MYKYHADLYLIPPFTALASEKHSQPAKASSCRREELPIARFLIQFGLFSAQMVYLKKLLDFFGGGNAYW